MPLINPHKYMAIRAQPYRVGHLGSLGLHRCLGKNLYNRNSVSQLASHSGQQSIASHLAGRLAGHRAGPPAGRPAGRLVRSGHLDVK